MTWEHLDPRLSAASLFVREGAFFADIGTDHAYLPLFLLQNGKISEAVGADVREGPLSVARKNAELAGLADRIDFRLTDGLQGMDDLPLTDIAICGMGGELIASIIASAPFVRKKNIRLILQPMSRAAHLRRFLAKEGFAVNDETICTSSGKHYACLCVSYTGVPYSLTDAEAECGQKLLHRAPNGIEYNYVAARLLSAKRRLQGMQSSEKYKENDAALVFETKLIDALETYLKEKKASTKGI